MGKASVSRAGHSGLVEGLRFCFVGLGLVGRAILKLLSYKEASHGAGDLEREGCTKTAFYPLHRIAPVYKTYSNGQMA